MGKVKNWAMRNEHGVIFYACEFFWGIQFEDGQKIAQGDCDPDCWLEIAHQLWAMKEGLLK